MGHAKRKSNKVKKTGSELFHEQFARKFEEWRSGAVGDVPAQLRGKLKRVKKEWWFLLASATFTVCYTHWIYQPGPEIRRETESLSQKFGSDISNLESRLNSRIEDQFQNAKNTAVTQVNGINSSLTTELNNTKNWMTGTANSVTGRLDSLEGMAGIMRHIAMPNGKSASFRIPRDKFDLLKKIFPDSDYKVIGPRAPASVAGKQDQSKPVWVTVRAKSKP